MSYSSHAENIRKAIADLRANRLKETTLMILDEIALIKRRVINEGKTSTGGSTGKYSEAVVPYWMLGSSIKNAAFNVKKVQAKVLKDVGYFASYKNFREAAGRPTVFKNFSMTGNMWKAVTAIVLDNSTDSTTYVIGSDDAEMQTLINYNKSQSGDFLAVSKEEDNLLAKLNEERVLNTLRKHNVI